jgi:hypothetical protein
MTVNVDSSWCIKRADELDMHSFAQMVERLGVLQSEIQSSDPNELSWWGIAEEMCVIARDVYFAVLREGIVDRPSLDNALERLRALRETLDNAGLPDDPDLSLYRAQIERRIGLIQGRKRFAGQPERALL